MNSPQPSRLGALRDRDEFIIAEALATALIALEQLPPARQPARNMSGMRMILNSFYDPSEASLHLTTARWRFPPSAHPSGARKEN